MSSATAPTCPGNRIQQNARTGSSGSKFLCRRSSAKHCSKSFRSSLPRTASWHASAGIMRRCACCRVSLFADSEPPRVSRRLFCLSYATLADLARCIISGFCLGGWNVADGAEETTIVEPVHPFERRHFNGLQIAPWSEAMDHFCLVQAVDRFSQGVIVGVAHAAHRRLDASVDQPIRIAVRYVLGPLIRVVNDALGARLHECHVGRTQHQLFATLECELLARSRFGSHEQARRELFAFIEGWYNLGRRHSAIGYYAPIRYETMHQQKMLAAGELPTAGRRRSRDRRPADRPWTTHAIAQPRGNQSRQDSTA
ncbi:conserved hypothetical protein [Paraburkholderia ribeironis]|uniref:Integrase catalytic domain-containing protein n=1 Tax=Paraburkholderia ribeironis TaxID=1247936 RepID=A0A1N7SDM4_9BURK|nr:conserved hypothetical protein [Paraburkholderia ribeironis]